MKVYVKKGEYQTPIPGIIITIVFLSVSLRIFYSCFSYDSFIKVLEHIGINLVFALVFFVFLLFFICILLKRPKAYSAKLTQKNIENYKGKQITYMTFTTEKEAQEEDFVPETYTCYTYGSNDLIENENYIIKIKEFNWKIKAVEEINDLKNNTAKVTNMTLSTSFLSIGSIFVGLGFFSILRFNNVSTICCNLYYYFNIFYYSIMCCYQIFKNMETGQ